MTETFADRIAAAATGNRERMLELLLDCQPDLTEFVRSQLSSTLRQTVSEDDILQETFVSAFGAVDTVRATDRIGFLAWLKTIATNRIRDLGRRQASAKRGGDRVRVENVKSPNTSQAAELVAEISAGAGTPSQFAAKQEAISAIQVALGALSEEQREAVRLHHFEKLTLEETAEQMGRSRDSVRGLIQRAKQALRASMDHSTMWLSKK